jgi:nucleotide-binding universal stress UspA family protein
VIMFRADLWRGEVDDRIAPDPLSNRQAATAASVENWLATISTLMACMSTDRSNTELLAVVADLARRFSAAVIGVWARQLSMHSPIMAIVPGEPSGHEPDKFRECAALEAEFRTALSMVSDLRWRAQMTAGPKSQYVANEARAADLLVAAVEPGERIISSSAEIEVTDLLMRGGRPILMAPAGAAGLKLARTLVCWKDSREARRAVADALPILKASQAVDVVELVSDHEIEPARSRLADVGDWLASHGVEASCVATPLSGAESAHLAANDLEADLIVAGAFGHSRLREWAFGGVTRDLLVVSH